MARDRKIVAATLIGNGFFPAIGGRDAEVVASSQGLRQNHEKLSVVVLVFLNKGERLAIGGDRFHAERVEQREGHNAQTVSPRDQGSGGSAGKRAILFQRCVELMMINAHRSSKRSFGARLRKVE